MQDKQIVFPFTVLRLFVCFLFVCQVYLLVCHKYLLSTFAAILTFRCCFLKHNWIQQQLIINIYHHHHHIIRDTINMLFREFILFVKLKAKGGYKNRFQHRIIILENNQYFYIQFLADIIFLN